MTDPYATQPIALDQNQREGNWIPIPPVTGSSPEADLLERADELGWSGSGPVGETSDGYHTFNELYDHRRALTAVLATIGSINGDSWKSKQHHPDDKPMFDGYFIVGIELPAGQISYHYSLDFWDQFDGVPEHEYAPKWDGHTSGDVVERLFGFKDLLKQAIDEGHEVVGMAREAAERTVAAVQAELGIDAHPVLDRPGKTRGSDEVLG